MTGLLLTFSRILGLPKKETLFKEMFILSATVFLVKHFFCLSFIFVTFFTMSSPDTSYIVSLLVLGLPFLIPL